MAIDTEGYLTVAEAADRLQLSRGQVRRRLRTGKLKGRRVGNHWIVNEEAVNHRPPNGMFSDEFIAAVHRLQDEVAEYGRVQGDAPIDVLELIRRHREEA